MGLGFRCIVLGLSAALVIGVSGCGASTPAKQGTTRTLSGRPIGQPLDGGVTAISVAPNGSGFVAGDMTGLVSARNMDGTRRWDARLGHRFALGVWPAPTLDMVIASSVATDPSGGYTGGGVDCMGRSGALWHVDPPRPGMVAEVHTAARRPLALVAFIAIDGGDSRLLWVRPANGSTIASATLGRATSLHVSTDADLRTVVVASIDVSSSPDAPATGRLTSFRDEREVSSERRVPHAAAAVLDRDSLVAIDASGTATIRRWRDGAWIDGTTRTLSAYPSWVDAARGSVFVGQQKLEQRDSERYHTVRLVACSSADLTPRWTRDFRFTGDPVLSMTTGGRWLFVGPELESATRALLIDSVNGTQYDLPESVLCVAASPSGLVAGTRDGRLLALGPPH